MKTNAAPRFPWLAIAALAATSAAGAGWLHVAWREELLQAARAELVAVADLQARQIAAWRAERLEEGRVVFASALVTAAAGQVLAGTAPESQRLAFDGFLRGLASHWAYSEALLVDASGRVLAGASEGSAPLDPASAEVRRAIASREIQIAEIVRHSPDDPPHLHLVVPIEEAGAVRGGLALRMEAAQVLYPLLASWAGGRPGTETSLVRRDGDAVQWLNAPAGSPRAALTRRAPLGDLHLPAVRAALGEEGLVEGRDGRGGAVLAALRAVPGSSWHVVTQVDRAAVLGPLQGRSGAAVLGAALLVGGAGLLVGARFRQQRELFAARHADLEQQLRTRQLDLLVRSANDVVFLCDEELRFLDVNERVTALYGYTAEETRRLTALDLRVGGAPGDVAALKARAGGAAGLVFESTHRRKDGSTFPVEVSARSMVVDGRTYFTGVIRDVTERKRAEAANAYQAMLLDRLDDAVVGSAPDFTITAWNRAAERVYGFSAAEALGKSAPELLHSQVISDDRPALAARPSADGSGVVLLRQRRRDGSFVEVESTVVVLRDAGGAVAGYVGVNRDLTRLRRAEAQQAAAERLAALGALAGGVAHEVNNPLAYVAADIRSAAQALRDHAAACGAAGSLEDAEAALAEADVGTRQIAAVVRDLQTYARARGEPRGLVDVRAAARSAAALAHNTVRHRATLQLDLGEAPRVEADAQDLTQALLRLLLHSAQSIPEGRAAENQVRLLTAGLPGAAVVEVRDTSPGPGSGATPAPGKAARDSPGLDAARAAVAAMGGSLEVEALGDRGTCYRITLPAGRPSAGAPQAGSPSPIPSSAPPREAARRGRILVVDDEPLVGRAVGRLLASEHEVVVEFDGRAAEARLLAGERFDLVLCDLMMPDVTGMELHDRLQASRPDDAARLVFMTGGAFTERAREFLDRTGAPCVEKPFDLERLRALVAERVGGSRSA